MVMATQNPIEQEGTYPLPEAQLDRFLMQVIIDYPDPQHEADILRLVRSEALSNVVSLNDTQDHPATATSSEPSSTLSLDALFAARREVLEVYLADNVEAYLVRLVTTSRNAAHLDEELGRWINYGASPRGTLSLDSAARAHAWLAGRDYVSPGDVQAVIHDVLRHRILLTYEAEADGVGASDVIDLSLIHI